METENIRKYLIEALERINKVTAMPKRQRQLATRTLNSKEIEHLAKHIIKITLWPNSQHFNGWLKEIKASLYNITFGVSKYSKRVGTKRYIDELWYDCSEILNRLNEEHDTAYWDVIDEMSSMVGEIEYDPFNENKDLIDIGYHLKEERQEDLGITISLWLNNQKII